MAFYIEVTNANADKVPEDYRRRQTLKNAERYITPELKAFEDKALVGAGPRAGAREAAIRSRSRRRCSRSPDPAAIARAVAHVDLLAGSGRCRAAQRNWCRPEFAPTALNHHRTRPPPGGRGEMANSGADTFIANDCRARRQPPPAAHHRPEHGLARSTYMRQVALIALLAHDRQLRAGRRAAVLGPIDPIFTRIGAADDLASGRSTFMVEMTEMRPPSCTTPRLNRAWC